MTTSERDIYTLQKLKAAADKAHLTKHVLAVKAQSTSGGPELVSNRAPNIADRECTVVIQIMH